MIATMTSKGQITIPKEIRDRLGLKTGDKVVFHLLEGGGVRVEPRNVDTLSLAGCLRSRVRLTLDEIEEGIGEGAVASAMGEDP